MRSETKLRYEGMARLPPAGEILAAPGAAEMAFTPIFEYACGADGADAALAPAGWVPAAGSHTDQWQIQNVYLIADAVEMDAGLLNKYVQHLAQGFSLSWEIKTLNSVLHSVGNSHANFSCNQSRAYTKLDTMFATLVRNEAEGTAISGCKKPVNWFQGLAGEHVAGIIPDSNSDGLESCITLGSKRIPGFPESKTNMHYFRLLQAVGNNGEKHGSRD